MSDFIAEQAYEKAKLKVEEDCPELFLKDLFYMITERELDKLIVGERDSRKVIFLCALGSLVNNSTTSSYNLLVNDVAGAGKDYITNATLKIFPNHRRIKRTRISPTVFTYWHNSTKEPDWTWDGKVLYLEDVSNSVLNSPVFKVMCSSGSYTTVVKDQRAVDIKINGKPVLIVTSATANPNPELVRRFTILNIDSGINQTKAIIERHLESAELGKSIELDRKILNSLCYLLPIKVKIPFAKKLKDYFPNHNVIMRTHILRFIDYIKASTALYQWQRDTDKEGYYIATEQDYQIAREVMNKTTSNQYMIPLTKDQRRILDVFDELGNESWWTAAELEPRITFMSERWLRQQLDKLVDYGLLNKDIENPETTKGKRSMIYSKINIEKIDLPEKIYIN